MSAFRTLDQADLAGKRVLVRLDLNVPMENGGVTDVTRIERQAPTVIEIADKGGKAILLSHLGRPKGPSPKDSLRPVAAEVSRIIGRPVVFADDLGGPAARAAVESCVPAKFCVSRTHASIPARKRTIRPSWRSSLRWVTCLSTTRSPPRTGRMPRRKGSRTGFQRTLAAACRPSSR